MSNFKEDVKKIDFTSKNYDLIPEEDIPLWDDFVEAMQESFNKSLPDVVVRRTPYGAIAERNKK